MSDDLISRKAVLDKIALLNDREHGNEHFFFGIDTAREIIENEPVAYDKEKVIGKIRTVPHGYYNVETEKEIIGIVENGGDE